MLDNLEIQDPVHGFIYRDSHERELIDTRIFQRLRSLHQLAMAYLVYPGATHTRFDHSLGAFHVAGGLAKELVHSDSDRRLVRLATLLHDIGHGPFSHVAEPILKRHAAPGILSDKEESKIHEMREYRDGILKIITDLANPQNPLQFTENADHEAD